MAVAAEATGAEEAIGTEPGEFRLIAALEDDDDVQSVTANFEMSDEVMEALSSE